MTSFDEHSPDALVRTAFCSQANFSSWADPRGVELEISRIMYPMSCASMREELLELLKRRGIDEFDPYRLDAAMLDEFLERWRARQKRRKAAAAS